jgi:hypothetical protein
MRIGEAVWEEVVRWDYFARDTLGKQLVRCIDSVAANIARAMDATITLIIETFAGMPGALSRNPSLS